MTPFIKAMFPRPKHQAQLVCIALGMLAIYTTITFFYPLIPNIVPGKPAFDLEMLMRDGRQWLAPIYTIGIIVLYILFGWAMHIARVISTEEPEKALMLRWQILGGGAIFSIVLLWLYPITALDLLLYVVRTRLWVLYGGSPMIALPESYPGDPIIAFAGEYADEVSPYGPLWEILARIPVQLGAHDAISAVIAMKLLVLIGYLACAWLIGWMARPGEARRAGKAARSPLLPLMFFAWNPLILMQGLGNGHNDMLMLALIVLGIVMWQRGNWWATALALALAATIKSAGLLMIPLFGMALLFQEKTWRGRVLKGLSAAAIITMTAIGLYALTGPLPDAFQGTLKATLSRTGFAPVSAIRMILREFYPREWIAPIPRTAGRDLFILYYIFLMIRAWQGRYSLVTAGFLAYFSQLMLGPTFRIWYPMWLIPLAALSLTSRTFWHTFLFGLTAELSIISYFVLWRWFLRDWGWGKEGPLGPYWNYWTIMHLLTVPWTFGIPLLGPIWIEWRNRER
ncbi:MAG: DUF2029 domain-containing protein [Anaerolineae bacterium]|nr:DUF2029 domain-containing protein [Anaerolineae bacterium]